MKDHYTLYVRRYFLHIELAPEFEISLKTMQRLWAAVVPVCEQHNTRRVLIEADYPTRETQALDVYDHGKLIATLKSHVLRVGFCLYDYQPDDLSELINMISKLRTLTVRFFSDLDETLKWLQA